MNKVVVILMFMITLNLTFVWLNAMGFTQNIGPQGQSIPNMFNLTTTSGWLMTSFIFLGLSIMGAFISNLFKINAFAVVIFTELFWLPYANTVSIFNAILVDTPLVFSLGLIGMITTLLTLLYVYTMIEWSRVSGGF